MCEPLVRKAHRNLMQHGSGRDRVLAQTCYRQSSVSCSVTFTIVVEGSSAPHADRLRWRVVGSLDGQLIVGSG